MELIIMLMKSLSHIIDASMEDLAQCPVIVHFHIASS